MEIIKAEKARKCLKVEKCHLNLLKQIGYKLESLSDKLHCKLIQFVTPLFEGGKYECKQDPVLQVFLSNTSHMVGQLYMHRVSDEEVYIMTRLNELGEFKEANMLFEPKSKSNEKSVQTIVDCINSRLCTTLEYQLLIKQESEMRSRRKIIVDNKSENITNILRKLMPRQFGFKYHSSGYMTRDMMDIFFVKFVSGDKIIKVKKSFYQECSFNEGAFYSFFFHNNATQYSFPSGQYHTYENCQNGIEDFLNSILGA